MSDYLLAVNASNTADSAEHSFACLLLVEVSFSYVHTMSEGFDAPAWASVSINSSVAVGPWAAALETQLSHVQTSRRIASLAHGVDIATAALLSQWRGCFDFKQE